MEHDLKKEDDESTRKTSALYVIKKKPICTSLKGTNLLVGTDSEYNIGRHDTVQSKGRVPLSIF